MSFEGRSVVVSGGGAGMGEATALAYGRLGAQVVVGDVDAGAAERVVKAVVAEGGTAVAHVFDLRVPEQARGVVEAAVEHFGRIDVLANVAGIYQNFLVEDMPDEFWRNMMAVDLEGPLHTMQAAIPHMKERGGAIVNVGSGAGFYPIAGLSAYGAAKAGLLALGRNVAYENAPRIRVNYVIPGPTMTVGVKVRPAQSASVAASRGDRDIPVDRWLDPAEIADVIVWVSSDKAGAVNGAMLRVDAGRYML